MSARLAGSAIAVASLAFGAQVRAADDSATCEPADLSALSGWGGVWAAEGGSDAVAQGISGRDGVGGSKLMNPGAPWNLDGQGRFLGALRYASKSGTNQSGFGYPQMMDAFAEFKFNISPSEVTIVNQYSEVRSIYTDGRGHMPEDEIWPTNWGDSVGCWEGDTLVIDTIAVRYDPGFNAYAPPLSDDAHFVERMTLVAPGRIESIMTITDPATLREPWIVTITYIDAGIDRLVLDAFQERNDTAAQTITDAAPTFEAAPLPPNMALTDAQLDGIVGSYELAELPMQMIIERHGDQLFLMVPPAQANPVPMYAETPLKFTSLVNTTTEFTLDAEGRAIGFVGTRPDGSPLHGTRVAD